MRVTYTNKFWHILCFYAFHLLNSLLVQGTVVLLGAYLAYSSASHTLKCSGATCVALGFVLFLIFYIAAWAAQLLFNGLYLYSRRNVTVLTEHRLEIQEEGLYEETRYNRSLFLWGGIFKVTTFWVYIAIYNTPYSALVVPVSAFGSTNECSSFIATLKERVSAARAK